MDQHLRPAAARRARDRPGEQSRRHRRRRHRRRAHRRGRAADLPAAAAREVVDVSGKLVLPGLIDTHAHVYQHVTGKFGLPADMVGVGSGGDDGGGPGRPVLHDDRPASAITSPSRRAPACCASSPPIWSAGWKGICIPSCTGPAGVNVAATVRAARDNADLVRGIKAHAEIGGASRWGLEVIKLGKQIAREAGLPLYIHLGQLWPTKDGASDRSRRGGARADAADGAGRRPGASVHPPSRRLHLGRDRRGASGGLGGAGARRDGRCRPRLAFQLRDGAQGAGGGHPARTRWAPTCTATTCACPSRRPTRGEGGQSVLRRRAVQPDACDDRAADARHDARRRSLRR